MTSHSEDEGSIFVPENDRENSGINVDLEKNCARFLLTNARSLMLKTDALNDAFESLNLNFACITETWFKGGKELRRKLNDIEGATGVKYIHKSRDGRTKNVGGGVAIAFNSGTCNLKQRPMKGVLKEHEVVCAVGKMAWLRRTIAVFTVYVLPRTTVGDRARIGEGLAAEITEICSKFARPAIIIGGDFNHADVGGALKDVWDFSEVATGPTRGNNKLDIIYTNLTSETVAANTLPPLQAYDGALSDHRCLYAECSLGQNKNYEWVVKMSRKRTHRSEEEFAAEMASWTLEDHLPGPAEVDDMAARLEQKIIALTDKHFPLQQIRRRSNEDPWITRHIRRLWKRKLRLYKKGGCSPAWWATDDQLQETIADSKEAFVEKLLEDGGNGKSFYSATKRLSSATAAKNWEVTDLFACKPPGGSWCAGVGILRKDRDS